MTDHTPTIDRMFRERRRLEQYLHSDMHSVAVVNATLAEIRRLYDEEARLTDLDAYGTDDNEWDEFEDA